MSTITMYDDITLSLLPMGAQAYAGYVNGRFENFAALAAMMPAGTDLLDISVTASGNAACLDVETGDATIPQIKPWFKAQAARGVYRPCIYTQAGNLSELYATMSANGFARQTYRVWSAHYTLSAHICGPASCGYSLNGSPADGTQWTDVALGRSLDESLLDANFFATKPTPPPPPPPGKATQPTHVSGSAKYTNATITWYGAKDVTSYSMNIIDVATEVNTQEEFESTHNSGSFTFKHLKKNHEYKLGIYAQHGAEGTTSQWVTVTTK